MRRGEEAARRGGRCARFAVQAVSRYKFTCALTGLGDAEGAALLPNGAEGAARELGDFRVWAGGTFALGGKRDAGLWSLGSPD